MASLIVTGDSWSSTFPAAPTNLTHGLPYTVTGSGFGTKTANTLVWDDCSHGQSMATRWSGVWPTTAGAGSNMDYRTPAALGRGVATPHTNVSAYACGCHLNQNTATGGNNVALWRSFTRGSFPFWSVWHYYERVDPSFDQQSSDNNFKWHGYSVGATIYELPNNWYMEYYDPWLDNGTGLLGTHTNDDAGGAGFEEAGTIYGAQQPNPKTAWRKKEIILRLSNTSGQGWVIVRVNNTSIINETNTGYTDAYSGTSRSDGIGGYARGRGANNWRYFGDIYSDIGTSPARFYLTNNATFNSATIVEVQPWSTWADGSVVLTCNKGQLSSGTVHLHYRNEAGTPQYIGTRTIA